MASRNTKTILIGSILLIAVAGYATLPVLHRAGFYFGGYRLEKIDFDGDNISVGRATSSGVPAPLTGDLIVAAAGTYEPKFPYLDFFQARKTAKADSFQMVLKQDLPEGSYCIVLSNSASKIVLPLEKRTKGLYVSSPFLILAPHAYRTYFYGYGILGQEPGTEDSINLEVDKVIPNWK